MCSRKAMRLALFMERGHCVFFLWLPLLFMSAPAPTLPTPDDLCLDNDDEEKALTVTDVFTEVLLCTTIPPPVAFLAFDETPLVVAVTLTTLFARFSFCFFRAKARPSRWCSARRRAVGTSSGRDSFSSCSGDRAAMREWSREMS